MQIITTKELAQLLVPTVCNISVCFNVKISEFIITGLEKEKVNSNPIFATQFATDMLVCASIGLQLCYNWCHKSFCYSY